MAISTVPRILEVLMLSILLIWICVWVLRPTKLWKNHWRSAAGEIRKTSFLGDYAMDIIVFCYPVLSMAVLGYLYQYVLQNKRRVRNRNGEQRRSRWIDLSSPVIVGGPIGVVSGGDLLGALLFASLLAWTIYRYVSSDFHKILGEEAPHLGRFQVKAKAAKHIGIRFGNLSEICMAILFFPILRGMPLFKIIGTQFEASVRYHVWIANMLILFAVMHGGTIMFIWAENHTFWSEIRKWQRTGRVYLAGVITLVTGVAIWITSLPPIRRKRFQFFYAAHHLYIIFVTFYLFHCGDRHFYSVFPGVLLFALDKILRSLQSSSSQCLISARLHPCKAIELTLSRDPSVRFNPTSMLFLNIPSISRFQWHPFSVFTNENGGKDRVSVIIKCHGWWTKAVYEKIQAMVVDSEDKQHSIRCLPIAVEGPYGPLENPIQRYDSMILVSGGSGVTPMLSIILEAALRETRAAFESEVHLVYAVKRLEDLSLLSPISSILSKQQTNNSFHLKLKAFVTQEEGTTRAAPNQFLQEVFQMKTISFDSTLPVNIAARRSDGLLWKAMITGFSCTVFSVVVLILRHIFVPTEKGAKGHHPSWINRLIVIASFVVATSSAIVGGFLQRRIGKTDMVAISHEVPARGRAISLSSEDEMGSMMAREHQIYFGTRPDIAAVLEDVSTQIIGKSRVGVFVCGPNAMQESAAMFCRKKSPTFSAEKPRFELHSLNFSL